MTNVFVSLCSCEGCFDIQRHRNGFGRRGLVPGLCRTSTCTYGAERALHAHDESLMQLRANRVFNPTTVTEVCVCICSIVLDCCLRSSEESYACDEELEGQSGGVCPRTPFGSATMEFPCLSFRVVSMHVATVYVRSAFVGISFVQVRVIYLIPACWGLVLAVVQKDRAIARESCQNLEQEAECPSFGV